MTRRPRRTLPAFLVAVVLLAVGALAATSAIQTLLGRNPVVSLDVVPSALSGVAWESPAILIVAAVIGLVLLLAAILPGPSHVLPLAAAVPAGTAGGDVESAGWHRSDLATAPAPRPTLFVEMAVDAQGDAVAARDHLEQYALPRLRSALGTDRLPTELLLRTGRGGRDERRVA